MRNMNEVQHIEYKYDYVYEIICDDGLGTDVNFEPYLDRGPVFESLVKTLNTSKGRPSTGSRSAGRMVPILHPKASTKRSKARTSACGWLAFR